LERSDPSRPGTPGRAIEKKRATIKKQRRQACVATLGHDQSRRAIHLRSSEEPEEKGFYNLRSARQKKLKEISDVGKEQLDPTKKEKHRRTGAEKEKNILRYTYLR
jgi:hypothetical protein